MKQVAWKEVESESARKVEAVFFGSQHGSYVSVCCTVSVFSDPPFVWK